MTYFRLTYNIDKRDGKNTANYFNIWEEDRPEYKKAERREEKWEIRVTEIFDTEPEAIARKKELWKESRARLAVLKAEKEASKQAKIAARENKKAEAKAKIERFASPEIKKIVKELFQIQKENVLKNLQAHYTAALPVIKSLEGFAAMSPEVCANNENQFYARLYQNVMQVSEGENRYSPRTARYLNKNHKQIIERMIQDDLNSIMDSFLAKMEFKLAETIKFKKIKSFTSKGLHQGWVKFEFQDGSKFEMENSIEMGRSKYGVIFNRFPCRFRNVIMSDGSVMKQPSEVKMKEEF